MTSVPSEAETPTPKLARVWPLYIAIASLATVMFVIRLAAPPNLLDQDQERPAAYVLDAVKNGNWLCQRDLSGDITSKPPVWTWIAALVSMLSGRVTVFSIYLPGALAALGTAWLVLAAGLRYFGVRAAFFAAIAVLLHTAGFKEVGLARTDGVFAFTVTLTALLAFRSWRTGSGWTWFWLAAAISTLTKGPLGIVFAACGLLACLWERRRDKTVVLRGSHWLGLGVFLVVAGGWFYLSYQQLGQPVVDKLIGRELVGHVAASKKASLPGTLIWQPPLYYLSRSLPWSLLAYFGLWRVWKFAAPDAAERRFERFLFCWFLGGLLLLSLAPHQRADLLWPIMPAAALLAGRQLDRLTLGWRRPVLNAALTAVVFLMVAGYAINYSILKSRSTPVRQSVAVRDLAARMDALVGTEFPLTHLDDPSAFQMYLNTARPWVPAERAAALLRGPDAAFVALNNPTQLEAIRRPEDPLLYTVLQDDSGSGLKTRIVGNRPKLVAAPSMAFAYGPLTVRLSGAGLVEATEHVLRASGTGPCSITVANESTNAVPFRIILTQGAQTTDEQKLLSGRETWTVGAGR